MFIIPLFSKPSDLKYAMERSSIFDLMFNTTASIYVGLTSNSIIVAGKGTVPGEFALQYHLREWVIGNQLNNPKGLGNVGFLGTFSDEYNAIAETFPWKDKTSYCLNNGHVVKYTGQKLTPTKYNWSYIEPIMCLISDAPAENFNHVLKILEYHRTEDFVVYGKWKSNLTLYCYGKEVGLDDWYLEFAKRTIDNCVPVEHKKEKKVLVENQPIISNPSVTITEEKIYTKQPCGMISIIKKSDLKMRKNEQASFDLIINYFENQKEINNKILVTYDDIIQKINLVGEENKYVATEYVNTELFNTALIKLSYYMDKDKLIMVVDDGIIRHNFKEGFAIGYNKLYIVKNSNKNQIYTIPFKEINTLSPNPDTDKWHINKNIDLVLNYMGVIKTCDMALALELIIIRSYIANGLNFILKIE